MRVKPLSLSKSAMLRGAGIFPQATRSVTPGFPCTRTEKQRITGAHVKNFAAPSASPEPALALVTTKTGTMGRKTGAAPNTGPFPQTTGFPLTAAVFISREHMPCALSARDTIPASRPLDRNVCGSITERVLQTSIHWPTSPLWRLLWPLFCTALTPTVRLSGFGVPLDGYSYTSLLARLHAAPGLCALFCWLLCNLLLFILRTFSFRPCFAHLLYIIYKCVSLALWRTFGCPSCHFSLFSLPCTVLEATEFAFCCKCCTPECTIVYDYITVRQKLPALFKKMHEKRRGVGIWRVPLDFAALLGGKCSLSGRSGGQTRLLRGLMYNRMRIMWSAPAPAVPPAGRGPRRSRRCRCGWC